MLLFPAEYRVVVTSRTCLDDVVPPMRYAALVLPLVGRHPDLEHTVAVLQVVHGDSRPRSHVAHDHHDDATQVNN